MAARPPSTWFCRIKRIKESAWHAFLVRSLNWQRKSAPLRARFLTVICVYHKLPVRVKNFLRKSQKLCSQGFRTCQLVENNKYSQGLMEQGADH